MGMMYNKRIFEDAGVTKLPETWAEFLDLCETLKNYGVTPVNIQLASGSEFGTTHLMHNLYVNIAATRGVDGAKKLIEELDTNQTKYVDVPEFVTSLYQMLELRDKGYINEDFITTTFEKSQENFGTGVVAMHPCGDFILGPLADYDIDIQNDIGFFPVPYMDTPGMICTATEVGLGVYSGSEQKDLAFEFMDMYASKEVQTKYMESFPGVATFADVPHESNPIAEAIQSYGAEGQAFNGIFEQLKAWPEMENRGIIQEMFLGALTPEQVLEKVQAQAEIIAKSKGLEGW
jgi:ABC-type sugar transport system, periplasmic component